MQIAVCRCLNSDGCCVQSYATRNDGVLTPHLVSFLSLLSWIVVYLLGSQGVPQRSSELTDLS
jgi:hypothetical protein